MSAERPRTYPRRLVVYVLLVLLPVVTFWPSVFYYYGFRDDYSIIQEVDDEPGKVFVFCSSYARPVYGTLLETSAEWVDRIEDLKWMRLTGALMVGLVSASCFRALSGVGWGMGISALVAAVLAVLPAPQVITSWAICWIHPVAAILGLLSFLLAERASRSGRRWRQSLGTATAVSVMALGALSYQPNSLFYLVPVAAGLVVSGGERIRDRAWWVIRHLLVVGGGLGLAYLVVTFLFETGLIRPCSRMVFESDPLGKLWWFLKGPLQNALALVVLNNEYDKSRLVHMAAVSVTGLVLAGGAMREWRTRGSNAAGFWLAGLVILVLASFCVNLVASDRYVSYRTIWPLTSILIVFVVSSLWSMIGSRSRGGAFAALLLLVILLGSSAGLARYQSYELIAIPQAEELQVLEEGALRIDPDKGPRVFLVTPTPKDSPVDFRWADEFGSLTTDSDWTGKEMLKLVMKKRFPKIRDVAARYTLKMGRIMPSRQSFDVVIDLREISRFRPERG